MTTGEGVSNLAQVKGWVPGWRLRDPRIDKDEVRYKFEGEVCYHVPAGPEKHCVLFSFIQTPSVTEANKVTASHSQSSD